MKLDDDVKPITFLKNRTAELVRHVSTSGRSVVITQNGEAKVVVMDVAQYDRWRRTMALLKITAMAEADVEAGRTLSQDEAFDRATRAIRER
ncbi:MAG: type II toxin-antitoxin system Phd/YefM family antitoxin [Deltaproteobacteria bacterium]|nr:type II toxin-antitoxin system Phd/YefM family antitoxin [Deltaproteobacteria bacterium]